MPESDPSSGTKGTGSSHTGLSSSGTQECSTITQSVENSATLARAGAVGGGEKEDTPVQSSPSKQELGPLNWLPGVSMRTLLTQMSDSPPSPLQRGEKDTDIGQGAERPGGAIGALKMAKLKGQRLQSGPSLSLAEVLAGYKTIEAVPKGEWAASQRKKAGDELKVSIVWRGDEAEGEVKGMDEKTGEGGESKDDLQESMAAQSTKEEREEEEVKEKEREEEGREVEDGRVRDEVEDEKGKGLEKGGKVSTSENDPTNTSQYVSSSHGNANMAIPQSSESKDDLQESMAAQSTKEEGR